MDGAHSMGELRATDKILVGKPEGKSNFLELGVDGNVILKWMLGYKPC
jgi:hypothetical protein